jgi:hypothetical protein
MSSPFGGLEKLIPNWKALARSRERYLLGYATDSDLADKLDGLARRTPKDGPDGLTLTDSTTAWSWLKFVFGWTAALLWNVFTWTAVARIMGAALAPAAPAADSSFTAYFCLYALLLLAAGAAIGSVIELTKWTRNAWKLRGSQLTLERWPLRLDDAVRLRFQRPFRRTVDRPGEVRARLVCFERAILSQGTDSTAYNALVWDEDLPVHKVPPGRPAAEAEWLVRIPREAPASFRSASNRILWGIHVLLRVPGVVTGQSTFALQVAPEVPE